MTRRPSNPRPFAVERRPIALRDAPAYLRRRVAACEADPEPVERPEPARGRRLPGDLLDDVRRHLLPGGRFGRVLWPEGASS